MPEDSINQQSLEYHSKEPAGKIRIQPTKPLDTQLDLALAYSPGVAAPVLKIAENPEDSYKYTNKGNLVAIISNGTAILGLGNKGALASKPVMEGKAVLFKKFADIDVFDIEIDSENIDEIVRFCEMIAPTVGGINLEDIKAPECFEIETRLKKSLDIPVFHDDQHGTAIVTGAGLLNALEIADKNLEEAKVVINGAGSAGIAIGNYLELMGANKKNILLCDSKGVISTYRLPELNKYKAPFVQDTECKSLEDALNNADVFIGVSVKDVLTPAMLQSMNSNPIVFAMANPDPEINYDLAKSSRDDVILATGRSDYPNQVNNVLCFPFLFRGALNVRAKAITSAMMLATSKALAALAKEEVSDDVLQAYNLSSLSFGRDYILPKPLDHRVFDRVVPAVEEAARESGATL